MGCIQRAVRVSQSHSGPAPDLCLGGIGTSLVAAARVTFSSVDRSLIYSEGRFMVLFLS